MNTLPIATLSFMSKPNIPSNGTRAARLPVLLAGALAIALVIWLVGAASPGLFTNDAGQYLSTIDGLIAGRGLTTTALYYEVQAARGLPAPQTVWPPGLSLLAAGLSIVTGLEPVASLVSVGALAHGVTVVLIAVILARLVGGWPALLAAALYAVYPPALRMVLIGASEPLFAALGVAAAGCLIRAFEARDADRWWLAAASLFVGMSCLVRYHGVALIGALGLVALAGWLIAGRTRRTFTDGLILVVPAAAIFGGLLARNFAMTGRLTGGPTGPRALTPGELVEQSIWGVVEILGGDSGRWGRIAAAVLALGLLALLVQGIARYVRGGADTAVAHWRVALFGLAASAGMIGLVLVMALRPTGVKIEGRYFIPCIPLTLIALAALWPTRRPDAGSTLLSRLPVIGVFSACLALVAIGHTGFWRWLATGNEPRAIERILALPYDGGTLRSHLVAATQEDVPVLSNQSQALYTVLRRPTIGVPERRLTPTEWSAEAIVAHARKFGATRLVIFTRMPLGEADGSSDFVFQIPGRAPDDVRLLFHADDVLLYDITAPATQPKSPAR